MSYKILGYNAIYWLFICYLCMLLRVLEDLQASWSGCCRLSGMPQTTELTWIFLLMYCKYAATPEGHRASRFPCQRCKTHMGVLDSLGYLKCPYMLKDVWESEMSPRSSVSVNGILSTSSQTTCIQKIHLVT